MKNFQTVQLPAQMNLYAPDGSEIRLLAADVTGSMVHMTLPVGGVSLAMAHRTVTELWFFTAGEGEFWRKDDSGESVVAVTAGTSLNIPVGVHFQFRNTGDEPLCAVLVTMPPWPGEDEAYAVNGHF